MYKYYQIAEVRESTLQILSKIATKLLLDPLSQDVIGRFILAFVNVSI